MVIYADTANGMFFSGDDDCVNHTVSEADFIESLKELPDGTYIRCDDMSEEDIAKIKAPWVLKNNSRFNPGRRLPKTEQGENKMDKTTVELTNLKTARSNPIDLKNSTWVKKAIISTGRAHGVPMQNLPAFLSAVIKDIGVEIDRGMTMRDFGVFVRGAAKVWSK